MPSQVALSLKDWSTTPSSNQPLGSSAVGPDLDDNLRQMQAVVRNLAARNTIASAATTDLGSLDATTLTITGTTAITSLGTVSDGIWRFVVFSGALTLTHNATSLILPTGANITTAAGDCAIFQSQGGGNWRCLSYMRASGQPVAVQSFALSDLSNATADKTLNNAERQQVWDWQFTSANKIGFTFSGSGSGSSHTVLKVQGGAGNLLAALDVYGLSPTVPIFRVSNVGFTLQGAQQTANVNGADCSISSGSAPTFGTVNGGTLNLLGGDGSTSGGGGSGGAVVIAPGAGSLGAGSVTLRDNATTCSVTANATALTLTATTKLVLNGKHTYIDNISGTPTISSGGGIGATISGADSAFEVTIGTGGPTNVVVNFANTWPTTPQIAIAESSQAGANLNVTALSSTQITIDANGTGLSSGTKVRVIVLGLQ